MIPHVSNISVASIEFAGLASFLILVAWSRYQAWFLAALLAVSLLMVLSWLDSNELVALILFLAAPYLATRWIWGREDRDIGVVINLVAVWQVGLFLIMKGYPGFDFLDIFDDPLNVIGISYIMFRQIHLLIDAPYIGGLPFSTVRYVSYLMAFWTLLAGPIQRYQDFCAGLDSIGQPRSDAAIKDLHRIVNGLLKAFVIAPLFLDASDISTLQNSGAQWTDVAIVFYGYPIYLYLNFSGYVDIVIGVARLCGFTTIPENFNRPYLARNVQEFWSLWHISLGVWVRYHVFTPLSKFLLERGGRRLEGPLLIVAVLITFFLVGLWHGPTTNFVVFGVLQGFGVVAAGVYGKILKSTLDGDTRARYQESSLNRTASVALCFHFNCATFIFLNNSVDSVFQSFGRFLA